MRTVTDAFDRQPRDTSQVWIAQAERNVDRWGNQSTPVLIMTLAEELAEIADAFLETAAKPDHDAGPAAECYYRLAEVRKAGFGCRTSLQTLYEDDQGNPLPPEETPDLVTDYDREAVRDELDDAGALMHQIDWQTQGADRDA